MAFGGTGFGSGGGFGQPSNPAGGTGFGNNNTGSNAFGAPSNAGGFGAQQSAFGPPGNSAFGAPSATSSGFGAFGSNNAPASSGAFGGGSNTGSLFGSAAPKTGFGAPAATGTAGLFGGAAPSTGSAFGGSSAFNAPASTALGPAVGDAPGTAVAAFKSVQERDAPNALAMNNYQNVCFQEPYKKWSPDELRIVDYQQGRRFPNGTGTGGFGSSAFNTGLGGTAQNTGSGFGATSGTSGFGAANNMSGGFGAANPSSGFGAASAGTSAFGAAKPASSLFGGQSSGQTGFGGTTPATNAFGAPANNTGFGVNTTTGAFGGNNEAQKPGGFGAFGNPPANSGGFGSAPNAGSAFGSNTGASSAFGAPAQNSASSAFGAPPQQPQQNTSGFGGSSAFGNPNQPTTGANMFASKPGAFGQPSNTNSTSAFGAPPNSQTSSAFGAPSNNDTASSAFGAKPAANTGAGMFGGLGQNNSGAFASLSQNTTQQPAQASSLFGGLNQAQKPAGFGSPTPAWGAQAGNTQQAGSAFGTLGSQQQANNVGNSLFGNSLNQLNAGHQSLMASVTDPAAYGASALFGNLPAESQDPGPLAAPITVDKQPKRPSILPLYRLNPAAAPRLATPPNTRSFGVSNSMYGTPSSTSSAGHTPHPAARNLLTSSDGSLTRNLGKSISSSNLRRTLNTDDSILAPGAFSASQGASSHGGGIVKKLVISRDLRTDLFSTPTKKSQQESSGDASRKPSKRVSFETNERGADETDGQIDLTTPASSAADHGSAGESSALVIASSESEQSKGKELAIVHEEESSDVAAASRQTIAINAELGKYWMKPTLEEIQAMNRVQRSKVEGFTVGRHHAGWVRFDTAVDLNTIDVANLYHNVILFEPRSCTVYPNMATKPPVGKGLNVPATIMLHNSGPRAAKGRPGKLSQAAIDRHISRLRTIKETHFVSFNQETMDWTFTVEHFTTYGLDDDDDEDMDDATESKPSTGQTVSDSLPIKTGSDVEVFVPKHLLPGTFETYEHLSEGGDAEMTEVDRSVQPFLADHSVGSGPQNGADEPPFDWENEYAMSLDQESSSSSPGQHLATEQDDSSREADQLDVPPETPAGIMRARMRAIKQSSTPADVKVTAGDDWMAMLQKTISPKRDRAALKARLERSKLHDGQDKEEERRPMKSMTSGARGFATSLDLMKSIFDEPTGAAVGGKRLQFPYKRVTKKVGENPMGASDRELHDVLRPSWGPNGTLVYSAAPMQAASGSRARTTEANDLMTVMKGRIVSESQDIRMARFTNEMSAKAIQTHIRLSEIWVEDGVPTVRDPVISSFKEFTADVSNDAAGKQEMLVWELASVLFDAHQEGEETEAGKTRRRYELSRFLESLVADECSRGKAMASGENKKLVRAIKCLAGHRKAEACEQLVGDRTYRLATNVALIGTSDEAKGDNARQLQNWREGNMLSELSQPIRALWEMCSGNVGVCEGKNGGALEHRVESFVISRTFGLSWKQAFGLRLWYATPEAGSIADVVDMYEQAVAQGIETRPPPWFVDSGVKPIWKDPHADQRENLLWGLLRLYCKPDEVDLEAVLRPENHQLSPLDYRLTWQLGRALTANSRVSYGSNGKEKADAATTAFAAQLTNEGSWIDAAFVLMHLSDPNGRVMALREHLCRHAGRIGSGSENFARLTEQLKLPSEWVWHALALYHGSVSRQPATVVRCLLEAGAIAEAHRTLIKEVAPLAIIEEDYGHLYELIRAFEGRESLIADWHVGAGLYKNWLILKSRSAEDGPPSKDFVTALSQGLPNMDSNQTDASVYEIAALAFMSELVARWIENLAERGQMGYEEILKLPLAEDGLLKYSRNLAYIHYRNCMAGRA